MELVSKEFDELTAAELYELLQARVDVFVVEQNCAYRELDGVDQAARHIVLRDEQGLAAYARVFALPEELTTAKIGRVLTTRRGCGLGRKVMLAAMDYARSEGFARAALEAQTYAADFYRKLGFTECSEEYEEDGIPHVWMRADFD